MSGLVRVDLKMRDYCHECGYACCGLCPSKGYCVSPSFLCDCFPLVSAHEGFGFLGVNDYFIDSRCVGLGIKINDSCLGEILKGFLSELNSNSSVSFLEHDGVTLKIIKVLPSELPIYYKYLLK